MLRQLLSFSAFAAGEGLISVVIAIIDVTKAACERLGPVKAQHKLQTLLDAQTRQGQTALMLACAAG